MARAQVYAVALGVEIAIGAITPFQRATTSIQATYAGAIANIRYTFGAQPDLKARSGIFAIQDPLSISNINELAAFNPTQETEPAIQAFAQNCL